MYHYRKKNINFVLNSITERKRNLTSFLFYVIVILYLAGILFGAKQHIFVYTPKARYWKKTKWNFFVSGALATIEKLDLIMPRYAIKGGDVVLKCDHSVSPEQLYKVEWQKGGNKIFQYIKGRTPPFRHFPSVMTGAVLNVRIHIFPFLFPFASQREFQRVVETIIFFSVSLRPGLSIVCPGN